MLFFYVLLCGRQNQMIFHRFFLFTQFYDRFHWPVGCNCGHFPVKLCYIYFLASVQLFLAACDSENLLVINRFLIVIGGWFDLALMKCLLAWFSEWVEGHVKKVRVHNAYVCSDFDPLCLINWKVFFSFCLPLVRSHLNQVAKITLTLREFTIACINVIDNHMRSYPFNGTSCEPFDIWKNVV